MLDKKWYHTWCTAMCLLTLPAVVNIISQVPHWYWVLLSSWVCRWLFRLPRLKYWGLYFRFCIFYCLHFTWQRFYYIYNKCKVFPLCATWCAGPGGMISVIRKTKIFSMFSKHNNVFTLKTAEQKVQWYCLSDSSVSDGW